MDVESVESWHEDATVYSEVICDAKDTFYYGSDDEHYADPADRRRRYEAAANRFLAGEQRSILSASLRGPFELGQGWLNPWRSRQHAQRSASAPQPANTSTSRPRNELPAETQDSLDCHLPSPESLKQVEVLPHPFLENEQVDRVQIWQRTLQPSKPQDELMEDVPLGTQKSTSQKRRRVKSSDWLRQSSNKKHKTGSIEVESVKTPSRSRKAVMPGSSVDPNSSLKTAFQSSQLCPGIQDDDDELAVDDEPSRGPNSSFTSQKRPKSPTKRISPKRAMLKGRDSDAAESADELSQETAKDTQAAATLSSPVSNKTTPKKAANQPPPQHTGSPVKKVRTPRIRKSRLKHKIEALRAPLPRLGEKKVDHTTMAETRQVQEKTAEVSELQPKQDSTPDLETQEDESFMFKMRRKLERDQFMGPMSVRASSPLSDISSSYGSVSWSGISSPEKEATELITRETSTQSAANSSSGDEKDEEAQGNDDIDQRSDVSSELSDICMADIYLRASSVMRFNELLPTSEKKRLDEELDSADAQSDVSEEEQAWTDERASNYETARSRSLNRQATPAAASKDLEQETLFNSMMQHGVDEAPVSSSSDQEQSANASAITTISREEDEATSNLQQGIDVSCADEPSRPEPAAEEYDPSTSSDSASEVDGRDESVKGDHEHTEEAVPATEAAIEASKGIGPLGPQDHEDTVAQSPLEDPEESAIQTQEIADSMDVDSPAEGFIGSTQGDQVFKSGSLDAPMQSPWSKSQATQNMAQPVNVTSSANATGITAPDAKPASEDVQTPRAQRDTEEATGDSNDAVDNISKQAILLPPPSFESTLSESATEPLRAGLAAQPSTPPQPSTPEKAFLPFAAFMSPSPERRARQRRLAQNRGSSRRVSNIEGSSLSSIMKSFSNTSKSKKRVSFAPLPREEGTDIFSTAPERAERNRPASPPPQTAVESLPTSTEAEFQGHFNAVAKRAADAPLRSTSAVPQSSSGSQDVYAPAERAFATDRDSNSTEASKKSILGVLNLENDPVSQANEDMDAIFDDLAFSLRPYDIDAELEDSRLGGETGMEGVSFGGW